MSAGLDICLLEHHPTRFVSHAYVVCNSMVHPVPSACIKAFLCSPIITNLWNNTWNVQRATTQRTLSVRGKRLEAPSFSESQQTSACTHTSQRSDRKQITQQITHTENRQYLQGHLLRALSNLSEICPSPWRLAVAQPPHPNPHQCPA